MIKIIFLIITFIIQLNAKLDFKVEPVSIDQSDLGEDITAEIYVYDKEVFTLEICPHWDERLQELYHVDINEFKVCLLNVNNGHRQCEQLNDLTSLVIPYEHGNDLLVTQRNRLGKLNWNTKKWSLIGQVAAEFKGKERWNDGKIDAKGRFWGGTLTNGDNNTVIPGHGNLYKLVGDKFIKEADGFTLTNGMIWSHDNRKMFVNDSRGRRIYVFDYDLQNGTVSNKKVLVNCDTNSGFKPHEYPDGLTIDQYGHLWSALYNGSGVIRVNPETGDVEERIVIPSPLTTSVMFGGPNYAQLFVTTAYKNFGPDLRKQWPNAGKVFRVTADAVSFRGAGPAYRFKPEVTF